MTYLWLKALHLIGIITWLAGIFYIWRLYVYHAEATSEDVRRQLGVMEARLCRFIMRPAFVAAVGFGLLLLWMRWESYLGATWIWIKLVLVLGVIVNHGLAESYRLRFARGEVFGSSRRFRILNEVPTLLMIVIVLLAVLKDSLWS